MTKDTVKEVILYQGQKIHDFESNRPQDKFL